MARGFGTELLNIVEVDADNRIRAGVAFDLDDIDAAFEELDARYLAGGAAAHAHTWSVVTGAYAAINRRELPPTTPDWVNIVHRRRLPMIESATCDAIPVALHWSYRPIPRLHRGSASTERFGAVVTLASARDVARRASTPSGGGSVF